MGIKLLKILISIILIISAFAGIEYFIAIPNGVKVKVAKIQSSFEGVILRKIKVRDTDVPTHLEVKINNGKETIKIGPNQLVVDYSSVGDSILKPPNENTVYIHKSNGEKRDFFYTKLSYNTRLHRNFPKKWKNKWLRSSEWDNKN